ncbi:MAG: RNA polymerase subunit sigma-70 [Planctomycetes bacterium RBG_16_64_10]|nr:MAG: RNA polymerase subunit sigma-70 [Planctomycetes bacterium RBG_16_64_10]
MVNDDVQLIDAALSGDSTAFGELVTKYQNRLYNTMVQVVGSVEDAQDVVQEAFVQAFVTLDRFRRASAFYTWLYRIAFNTAMSQKRRRRPTASVEETRARTGDDPVDEAPPPDRRMLQAERVAQVRAALAMLSEEHRAILVLREIDGRPYDEIAEILALPIGTVRSRLHRARLQLREQLSAFVEPQA